MLSFLYFYYMMWWERAAAHLSLGAAPDTELIMERGQGSRWGVVSRWAWCHLKSLCKAATMVIYVFLMVCCFVYS